MKKKLFGLLLSLMIIFAFAMSGCSSGKRLKDFEEYKNLDLKSVVSIDVELATSWGIAEFKIDNNRAVKKITDMYSRRIFELTDEESVKDAGQIVMHTDSCDYTVSLSAIKCGDEIFGNNSVHIHLEHYALENRLDRVYYNIQQLAKGQVDLNKIVKIEVGWQTTEEYVASSMTYFDITEQQTINYIIEMLSGKKSFVTAEVDPTYENFTHLKFYDENGNSYIKNITEYADPHCTSDDVKNYVYEYGITNGYLEG